MNRNYEDKSLPSWNVSVFEKWEGGKEERETRLLLKFGGGIMLVLCNARKKAMAGNLNNNIYWMYMNKYPRWLCLFATVQQYKQHTKAGG